MQFAAHDFVLRKCALSRKLPLDLCNVRIIIRIPTTHTQTFAYAKTCLFYAFANKPSLIFNLFRTYETEQFSEERFDAHVML